jgi:poly-gamma-glutamate synthesis protein (capsule biosynthesis protein)
MDIREHDPGGKGKRVSHLITSLQNMVQCHLELQDSLKLPIIIIILVGLLFIVGTQTVGRESYPKIQQQASYSSSLPQVDRLINQRQTNQKQGLIYCKTLSQEMSKEMFSGMKNAGKKATDKPSMIFNLITIFMCGDVMTGRGIDQVLPHPSDPLIHEPYMRSARGYVELAEKANGPIQQPVSFSYIWGDALEELERVAPDVRMINLETSITKSTDYWKGKGINYRMHPENIPCLLAAKIGYCSLANNHILDWGYSGLAETLLTLKKVNVKTAGVGQNIKEAHIPAVMEVEGKGRVIVFSFGSKTSGIPPRWAATEEKPGVNLLRDLSDRTVQYIKESVQEVKQQGDIVVVSIHWGGNWGYKIPREQRDFAHKLIDDAGADVIHGHSSHHVKGMEVYKDRPIIYGCGDFLNDYEGIAGYESFRADLGLMYFLTMDPSTGRLVHLHMTPTQIKRFKVNRASRADALWLRDSLNREGRKLGTRVELKEDNTLTLQWD